MLEAVEQEMKWTNLSEEGTQNDRSRQARECDAVNGSFHSSDDSSDSSCTYCAAMQCIVLIVLSIVRDARLIEQKEAM